jgi:hypothetical protein
VTRLSGGPRDPSAWGEARPEPTVRCRAWPSCSYLTQQNYFSKKKNSTPTISAQFLYVVKSYSDVRTYRRATRQAGQLARAREWIPTGAGPHAAEREKGRRTCGVVASLSRARGPAARGVACDGRTWSVRVVGMEMDGGDGCRAIIGRARIRHALPCQRPSGRRVCNSRFTVETWL